MLLPMSLASLSLLSGAALAQRSPSAASVPPATIHESEWREITGSTREDSLPRTVQIALPQGYADNSKRFPVIYVLDADGLFPMVSDIARVLAIGGEIPNAIVVGLGYGRPYMQTLSAEHAISRRPLWLRAQGPVVLHGSCGI